MQPSYYNSIWITGCAPGGTGEVRLVERNNESNVIARATIVVVQYTVPSHILHLRQTNQLDGALRVTWDAPRRKGGSDIVGYAVQHRRDGDSWASESPPVRDTTGMGTSHTVTGLMNGTKYHIRVTPCNRESACLHWSERMGFSHASVSGRPQAPTTPPPPPPITTPGPVRDLTLTPGDHELGVRWRAPSRTGGRTISRYPVRYKGEPAAVTVWTSNPEVTISDPAVTSVTTTVPILTGDDRLPLTNGAPYLVQVRACNGPTDRTDCGNWTEQTGTPEAPRPRNLDVVPKVGRKAELTWNPVPDAAMYEVQAQVLGQRDWHAAWCNGGVTDNASIVSKPGCVIDLDYVAGIGFGLHSHTAYALQVRAYRPQLSAYSEPVVIVDTPIFRAKGASTRVEVSWRPVDTIHSGIDAGGRYQLRSRGFRGDHTSVDWDPEDPGFLPTRPTALLPVGTTTHPIGNLVNYGLYAIQLVYDSPRQNAAAIKVFAARDAYAWPSDRAAGVGTDVDGKSYAGERVGTFPLKLPVSNRTYEYYICSDTFPLDIEPDLPDNPDPPDGIRAKSRVFIRDAFAQWEAATTTGPGTSLITMKYMGTICANYRPLIQPIVNEINASVTDGHSHEMIQDNVADVIQQLGDLTGLLDQDKERSEVIFVDVPTEELLLATGWTKRYVYFEEVAHKIGLNKCVFSVDACAADEELNGVVTTDILLNGARYSKNDSFTWDTPLVEFSRCSDFREPNSTRYSTLVHEAGHALGIRGTSERSGGGEQRIHHSQVEDSVMKSGSHNVCAPTPFDVVAIYALYQAED